LKKLLRQKGVFPYDYYKNKKVLFGGLPRYEEFYNKLTNTNITVEEYSRAKKVYKLGKCKNFNDYLQLYLICDVMLLADVFENFRKTCYNYYGLDPLYSLTAPGLSWQSMLLGRFRKNKLENYEYFYKENHKTKLTSFCEGQEDMLEIINNNKRGGPSIIVKRHAKANNEYVKDYNPNLPKSYIQYWDCNNLYGKSMASYLPSGNYKWVDKTLDDIINT